MLVFDDGTPLRPHWLRVQKVAEADEYIDALGIDETAVLWAAGHVASRAYSTSGTAPSLVPVVDLVNHSAAACEVVTCAAAVLLTLASH